MVSRLLHFLLLALILAGCATSPSRFTSPPDLYHPVEYPFYYDALYADLFWRCLPEEGGGVRIEGYAVSSTRTGLALFDFEVQLLALDAKGRVLAENWVYGDRITASNLEPVPFTISLKVKGNRYDLFYRFRVPAEGGNGHARNISSRPRIRLVGGGGFQEYFGVIPNACAQIWRWERRPFRYSF